MSFFFTFSLVQDVKKLERQVTDKENKINKIKKKDFLQAQANLESRPNESLNIFFKIFFFFWFWSF